MRSLLTCSVDALLQTKQQVLEFLLEALPSTHSAAVSKRLIAQRDGSGGSLSALWPEAGPRVVQVDDLGPFLGTQALLGMRAAEHEGDNVPHQVELGSYADHASRGKVQEAASIGPSLTLESILYEKKL